MKIKLQKGTFGAVLLFFVMLDCLMPFHGVFGKGIDEKKLEKKSQDLTYQGQMDFAKDLLGGDVEHTSLKKTDEGWDTTSLMLSMLWGSIGTGYFIYGKKQARFCFLLCGIGLCVFPMIISSNLVNLVLGVLMVGAPFKIDF